MFSHLIESDSHKKEMTRRGSFMLGTLVAYALFLLVGGIISIYAYDARLEEQFSETAVLISPAQIVDETPAVERHDPGRSSGINHTQPASNVNVSDNTSNAVSNLKLPDTISTQPASELLFPGKFSKSDNDVDSGITGPGRGDPNETIGGGRERSNNIVDTETTTAPPPMKPASPPAKRIKISHVLNGKMINTPKLDYPIIAKRSGAHGPVIVQIIVDEEGKVISAKAVSGNPLLYPAATRAAYQARFSPTLLSNQPVKVSGMITFNFILNR